MTYRDLPEGCRARLAAERARWILTRATRIVNGDETTARRVWVLMRRPIKGETDARFCGSYEVIHPLLWLMAAVGLVAVVAGDEAWLSET